MQGADVLDIFCLKNITMHSFTELSSDHNSVLLEKESWQDHQVQSTIRKSIEEDTGKGT